MACMVLTRWCKTVRFTGVGGRLGYKEYESIFSVTGPRFAVEFQCRGNVSITYRGSAYEQSWETHCCATGVCILYSDSRGVCQSATAPSRRTAAAP
jgi:hypothetical protein